MAKSLVEKYEQILASDPASTVFVELAKALIEKGENARAIEVCTAGLQHHAASVVGRVLWGKALINLGRPAEAMEQFDKAIATDRDNPHAYNLIGEVLLHKGLYRSALPLLRKAVALQPNDGRVRQWLEQTQAALAGGPAPILTDFTRVDAPEQPEEPPAPARETPEQGGGGFDPTATTQTDLRVISPAEPPPRTTSGELPVFEPAALAAEAAPPADDPFAAVPRRTSSSDALIGGLTATFDALAQDGGGDPAPAPSARREDPFDVVARRSARLPEEEDRGLTVPLQVGPPPKVVVDEPSIAVSNDLYLDGRVEHVDAGRQRGRAPSERPSAPVAPPVLAPAAPPPRRPQSSGGLLGDIPDFVEPTSSLEVPKVEVSTQAAEAIAREYERELREKLAQSKARRSFLARHWLKLSAAGVGLVVLAVGAFIYVRTMQVNQGSLNDALAEAKKAILQDTRGSYGQALEALGRAVRMDEESVEAWALTALANSVLYSEHGQKVDHRKAAERALARPGVRDGFPVLVQAAGYHLSEGKARQDRAKELVGSRVPDAEVNELAGRILLEGGDATAALGRFQKALQHQATNVRVLVALGDYYRRSGDFQKALEFYATAAALSPRHPARVLGAAESRLELGQEPQAALAEVDALPPDGELSEEHQARRLLVRGQLLAATGDPLKAVEVLADGAKRFKTRAYDFELALAQANRKAGRMGAAEVAAEAALKLRPRSEEARAVLARVLVDRGNEREALSKVPADPGSRAVSLARGVAYGRLGDWKRARIELERTQSDGKIPPEAAIWLELADAADGKADQAQKRLEKLLERTRKARGEVLVALGKLHQDKGELEAARIRFEEASKDPDDIEGSCAFGRLLLALGQPAKAVEPLERAAKRNDSHDEAHEALGKAYLALGRVAEAVALSERWEEATKSAGARRLSALALYQAGNLKEADKAATLAIRSDSKNPDAWRTRAIINFAQGDSRSAFKDLERSNKLDPKDADTFCEIGFAFLRLGNRDNAAVAFAAALRENADSTCGQVGKLYAELPRANRRDTDALEKLAAQAPAAADKAFAHLTRSRVLLAVGRPKEARAAAEEALKLAPWSGPAHLALGLAQVRLKDDGARQTLAQAVTLDPVNGNIRVAYGDLLARGDEAAQTMALDEYERFLKIGGDEDEEDRVKKALTHLKKRLASR